MLLYKKLLLMTFGTTLVLTALPLVQWLRERLSMLTLYVHCPSCFCSQQNELRDRGRTHEVD